MVARWIALGYGYVFVTIALIVVFVGGGTLLFATGTLSLLLVDNFAKIGIPLVIVAGLMLRAVFTRLPPPEGVYLEGELKQRVLAAFEDVRQRAGGRPIDEVVVVNELNAAVMQMPRFGLFGPTTNYLILGAPLLQLMSADEVKAVIAHEFGHLSHEHGRMGSMVYRLDQTLRAAGRALQEKARSGVQGVSFRFLDWFYGNFNRVTFAMRRGQEYEADRVAAEATSATALASALCKLYALDEPLGRFWNDVWQRPADADTNQGVFPQTELRAYVADTLDADGATQAVDAALQRDTDYSDSHPCLRDRLEALGVQPIRQHDVSRGALETLLSKDDQAALLRPVDANWQSVSAEAWQQSYSQFQASREELARMREVEDHDRQSLLHLASLEENLGNRERARDCYRRLVEMHPDDASAQFNWGRVNAGNDTATSEAALLRAVELDIWFMPNARQFLQEASPDNRERLASLEQTFDKECELADQERQSVTVEDSLIAVDMNEEFRAALVAHTQNYPEVRRLFLVEKPVQHMQHSRVFLLAFDVNYYHDNVETKEDQWFSRVAQDYSNAFPGLNRPFVAPVNKKSAWAERLPQIEGALVYEGTGKSKRTFFGYLKLSLYILLVAVIAFALLSNAMGW